MTRTENFVTREVSFATNGGLKIDLTISVHDPLGFAGEASQDVVEAVADALESAEVLDTFIQAFGADNVYAVEGGFIGFPPPPAEYSPNAQPEEDNYNGGFFADKDLF